MAHLSQLGIFVYTYAVYLAGERQKEESMIELSDPLERFQLFNKNLKRLSATFSALHKGGSSNSNSNSNSNNTKLDSFNLYMYGVILKELLPQNTKLLPKVKTILVSSILKNPNNWSCWLDLAEICISHESIHSSVEVELGELTQSYMYHFFLVHVFIEQQQNESALQVISMLEETFVNSGWLVGMRAVALYNLRDFDAAQEQVSGPKLLYKSVTQTNKNCYSSSTFAPKTHSESRTWTYTRTFFT